MRALVLVLFLVVLEGSKGRLSIWSVPGLQRRDGEKGRHKFFWFVVDDISGM